MRAWVFTAICTLLGSAAPAAAEFRAPTLLCSYDELCDDTSCDRLSPPLRIDVIDTLNSVPIFLLPDGLAPGRNKLPDDMAAAIVALESEAAAGRWPYAATTSEINGDTGRTVHQFGTLRPGRPFAMLQIDPDGPVYDSSFYRTAPRVFRDSLAQTWHGTCEKVSG